MSLWVCYRENVLVSGSDSVETLSDEANDTEEADSEAMYCGGGAGDRGESGSRAFSLRPSFAKLIRTGCWLYSHVARRTIAEPRINVAVMRKSKSATLARNESTILRLVAKPLRILSEYLITSAVTSPPRTCTHTVAHAHAPKCAKSPANGAPLPPAAC